MCIRDSNNTGQGNEWALGYPDSSDVAYKLVLTESRTLFIDTCDSITDFDTILAIKDTCFAVESETEADDSLEDFCPEASVEPSTFASGIDSLPLSAGTYYIIVDGYGTTQPEGDYKLAVGALPEIDTSYIASDDSYIEVVFTDPIYTNSNGTGGIQINDLELSLIHI